MMTEINVNDDKAPDKGSKSNIVDKMVDEMLPLCFMQERHLETIEGIESITQTWRMKERMKTVSVALVLCLNVGVDPPDVVKTQPCARLECWIDPLTMSASKSLEKIGANLQAQYERWQPRARYKQSLDPTAEEIKKLCTSLRRNAKEERVLFHYNGHGVPKPTSNGEIWVFNRNYTQYIPLSIYDLQTWMESPSIYVYDCSNAGIIIESFKTFANQHEREYEQSIQPKAQTSQSGTSIEQTSLPPTPLPPNYHNCIQLAACSANQVLPMNPDLPADLFTSCLTTPIKVAVRWFVLQSTSKLVPKVSLDLIDKIPGQVTDRRTMLGELNWIFTAITDTIAWNTLQRDLFQKLFRQDLLVASLFRNFLLAERILKSCDCTPISSPLLPPTAHHPMWQAWDLALDLSLSQLPGIIKNKETFRHLPFFEEQLTAFQVWLDLGCEERTPPEQLPIVLQVLLSQVHRVRALELLGRFLDLGPWAVNLALSVGIFPYVLKLLQSCAKELRPLLVYIWSKILAVDSTCQMDLVRDNGHKYFLAILQDSTVSSEHKTQSVFILAQIVNNFRDGQEAALQGSLVSICLEQLNDSNSNLRQWTAICLGRLWDHYEKARWTGVRDIAHEKLYVLLSDSCSEVRASAVFALGTFINSVTERSEHANNIDHSIIMTLIKTVSNDISPLVRKELVNALQWIILAFEHVFISVAIKEQNSSISLQDYITIGTNNLKRISSRDRLLSSKSEDSDKMIKRVSSSSSINNMGVPNSGKITNTGSLGTLPALGYGSIYMKIWNALTNLECDPYPEVATMSQTITKYIRSLVQEHIDFVDNKMNSSLSLPPSPNRSILLTTTTTTTTTTTIITTTTTTITNSGTYILTNNSPPIATTTISHNANNDVQKFAISHRTNRYKKLNQSIINEENDNEKINNYRKPLITTKFIDWACKKFAQSKNNINLGDIESKVYYERDWRYSRNNSIRKEAIEEQKRALICKLESQVFNTRTAISPSLLQFHPYDQQIAVVAKDTFGIWDWGTGAKTTVCHNKSIKFQTSRISSIEWINGHDVAMLMVASDDGSLKIWKPNTGQSREPTLISAWQAVNTNDLNQKSINRSFLSNGMVMVWEQWKQLLITAGCGKFIRFWDVNQELHAFDLSTGTDSYVTCIDSTYSSLNNDQRFNDFIININGGKNLFNNNLNNNFNEKPTNLVIVGCDDGSIRLFDRRCHPQDAKIKVWMEHLGAVVNLQLRGNTFISASNSGDVKIYDIRKNGAIHNVQVSHDMSCFSVHRSANMYACGSLNNVNIFTVNGLLLNTIKFYEGFMGHRTGPVTCLNFHPHKIVLATGTSDCSIGVFALEGRR